MKTLWDKLKPEYKEMIEYQIKSGKFTAGPQLTKRSLEQNCFFGELTIEELKCVFIWTDQCITEIVWQDLFGDRFLIEENK